ncbi:MAG: shikimate dehydrogenase [Kiritimatiellae bacterium]|nr:shikimate dehydrogenase [Kiritimatiellia bacterium]MDD5521067.1 shikimate dehydrogenase [Kiritimatiellia bacterium]
MNLSGHTKPFAVLGHPIGHTLSPVMHNAAIQSLGMDAIYLAFDVAPDTLISTLNSMACMGFRGVNLTVPLKEVAFKGLKKLDISAQRLGSVNTVEFLPGGHLKGHSTDGKGFLIAIKEAFGKTIEGLSVFVLGSGGAGRAVAITCAVAKASNIIVADIETKRARRVVAEISKLLPRSKVQWLKADPAVWVKECRKVDLVIQATPVGMKKADAPLLPPSAFRRGQMAFDLIYMYPETVFMKAARKSGAKTANGLGMLLHQGAISFSIWTGIKPPVKTMRNALEKQVYGRILSS